MFLRATALLLCLIAFASAQHPYDAMEWRLVGPFRGGRVLAVTGVPGDQRTFYFGSVGGGVWKTTDAGTVWMPVFDKQPIASIGAIAVAASNHNVIYVGTGEADMRSDISVGNGIYRSIDAGKTWTNVGLTGTQQIARIVVDPKNADVVFVAALGHAYASNTDRGVYKSTDGGAHWSKVLDKGPDIGAIDLAIEPDNPRILFAAMWNSRRPPWSQYGPIEGPGGGLYKSTDGGESWSALTGGGLPQGEWGRAGIAISQSGRSHRVYVLVDSKGGSGLYSSDDSGKSWTRRGSDPRITSRSWYFSGITVDTHNPDIVYVPNVAVYRSMDAGKTFEVLKGAPGGDDYHTLWVDPVDSSRMILGSDQGVNISVDNGSSWTTWYNQPTAQMYHVITDNQTPYWIYGSQQDSGTIALPSRTTHGSIYERDRQTVGGEESGYIAVDAKDPNIVYVGNTNGSLARFDKRTAQSQNITPWPEPAFGTEISQRKYRFPWTAPLIVGPLDPHPLYYGAQYLLKSLDGGLTWSEISPDLTGADPKEKSTTADGPPTIENSVGRGYGVIYSIAPSPLNAALIWVGTDTGRIQVTRTGGKQWSNVTPKDLSDWSKITQLDASHFDAAVAYAAVDRHRLDDYKPHIFRTRDYGKTWTEIDTGIEAPAFVNAVREDPLRKGLLYAATEMGVYVSFDDGDHWEPMQLNLPVTSVRDLVVHGNDLVIATHGRGFWVLDDIAALREKRTGDETYLFKPAPVLRLSNDGFLGTPFPPEDPRGKNPPNGAIIDYYLPAAAAEEATIEILDAKNEVIRKFSTKDQARPRRAGLAIADIWVEPPAHLSANAGMNRFVWDLRYAPPESVGAGRGGGGGGAAAGPLVIPGVYKVRLSVGGKSLTQPVKVTLDPHSAATPADLAAQFDLAMKAWRQMKRSADLAHKIQNAKKPELDKVLSGVTAANRSFGTVLGVVDSTDRRPPAAARAIYDKALKDLDAREAEFKKMSAGMESGQ